MNINPKRVCTARIVNYNHEYSCFVDDADSEWDNATPMTPSEIEKFTYNKGSTHND